MYSPFHTTPYLPPTCSLPPPAPLTNPLSNMPPTSHLVQPHEFIQPFCGRDDPNCLIVNVRCESWLDAITNLGTAYSDMAKIHVARALCKGDAPRYINSPLFYGIESWVDFANKCRVVFKEPLHPTHVLSYLSQVKMAHDQSPRDYLMDLHLLLNACQGELPTGIDVESLRVGLFRAGLPAWLKQSVCPVWDLLSFDKLLEFVYRIYYNIPNGTPLNLPPVVPLNVPTPTVVPLILRVPTAPLPSVVPLNVPVVPLNVPVVPLTPVAPVVPNLPPCHPLSPQFPQSSPLHLLLPSHPLLSP